MGCCYRKDSTVEEFLITAFSFLNLDWKDYVVTSDKYFRPNEVDYLPGNPDKINKALGWKPQLDFEGLVKLMLENDINEAEKEKTLIKNNLLKPTWEYPKI